ncbi:Cyclic di-GMP phosphodiesterase response regulator RpfG [Poriferisphaera corsica]|uniref:Cyclic di-GMP phosphodiesterase response regulator RpfG n=1 Tax=Poriferisphaera corsica TaxID=2528020 RepID=A0A517YZB5_9BACT|nr:HD domain-containing phosphohydrolase [Poriferisphaera corsica]QDU35576.1 Cyclic di-GMP phosphodiesterase response regulator RpfG [Poriferisphaera corsica]
MLRIDLHEAREGMALALPVQNPQVPTRALLKAGFKLSESIIRKLSDSGVKSLWVRYPALDFLDKFIDNSKLQAQQEVVTAITDTFEQLQTQAAAKMNYNTYLVNVAELVDSIISNPTSSLFLGDLTDSPNDLLRHSSATTYVSLLLALRLETYLVKERKHINPARAKTVTNLGLGAMLHDIGLTQLAQETLDKYQKTNDESDLAFQEHPAIGFRMVRGQIDPSAATVVLNHHQRFDGSGYAGKDIPILDGKNIHVFARLVAVAEQFDRLRNPQGLPQQPSVFALRTITSAPFSERFDPQILAALLDVVPPYAPGSVVKLSDDRHAVVIDHNIETPCRPIIQIIPNPATIDPNDEDPPVGPQIDLASQPNSLFISEAEGHDTADLNFPRPSLAQPQALAGAW